MNNFESQLSVFGKQRYSQTNKKLRHIINPRQRNISLSWITTPIAASIGILLGLGIQLNTDFATTIELPKFEIVINQINNEL